MIASYTNRASYSKPSHEAALESALRLHTFIARMSCRRTGLLVLKHDISTTSCKAAERFDCRIPTEETYSFVAGAGTGVFGYKVGLTWESPFKERSDAGCSGGEWHDRSQGHRKTQQLKQWRTRIKCEMRNAKCALIHT